MDCICSVAVCCLRVVASLRCQCAAEWGHLGSGAGGSAGSGVCGDKRLWMYFESQFQAVTSVSCRRHAVTSADFTQ